MPDYAEFNNLLPIAAKVEQHTHMGSGNVHLTIQIMGPAESQEVLEAIRRGFDVLMKKLSGKYPMQIESYEGTEADNHDIPLADYYESMGNNPKDSN